MEVLQWIILMTLCDGILAFSGVFLFFIPKKVFQKFLLFLVSFTAGSLLGGAFFHFLPESFGKIPLPTIFFLLIGGFVLFFLLEKYIYWRHCHEETCKVHPVSYLILYGDLIHNFIDGLIIASSFLVSIPFGIVSSLLIISHELAQEIGNFGVLVYGGFKKNKALFYNFFVQLSSVLGGVLGFYYFKIYEYSAYLLPVAAGGFIYISVVDLIPEAFKKRKLSSIIAIILGLALLLSTKIFVK